ncbi:autotransporter domain-containing protein [Novosphingobium sp.]|uniref:autotransporter outer membrane beta-barrel domain-containing protein n=1 Tax=Novosphingobium sp. TaxID=1874826 RepID=UPI0031CDD19E
MALCSAQTVWANCTTTGTTVVCDASAPNPYTNPVSGTNITLNPGAQVQPVDPFAGAALGYDSVLLSAAGQLNAQTGSSIVNTFGGKAVVAGAGSTVNMGGTITATNGGTGVNLGQGATLFLAQSGDIESSARVGITPNNSSAILVTGTGTTVQVYGILRNSSTFGGSAINMISTDFFANTVRGTGTISIAATGQVLTNGASSPAIILTSGSTLNIAGLVRAYTSSNAIDYRGTAGGVATVNVQAGGTVQSSGMPAIIGSTGAMNLTIAGTIKTGGAATAVQLGGGDDAVTLVTGASVDGAIDGGGGTNTLSLTGSGAGQLGVTRNFADVAINAGTWTLSAPLGATGGITIASGATGIGAASQWGSNLVSDAGTLVFNQGVDEVYSGTLTGSGQLVKSGTGTLTLGNQSGFTGTTLVSAGQLVMAGAMPSVVTVANGGTLAGNGSVGGLSLQSGSTVSPGTGSSVGTLAVTGNFAQGAGSIYAAQVVGSTADKITVTGTATLASGSKLVITTQNAVLGKSYTLLSANGGVSGQYTAVQSDVAYYRLTYNTDSVVLTFGRSNAAMLALAQGANQVGVANALVSLPFSNTLYSTLGLAPDDATVRAAYPQLNGDLHGAVRAAILHTADMLTEAALTRSGKHQTGLHLWGQLLGSTGNSTGLGGAAPVSRQSYGGVMGLEDGLGSVTVGLAAGYLHTRLAAATGTAGVNTPQVLGYARAALSGLSLQGGVGYVWASNHVSRQIAFAGFSDADQANYKGDVLHAFGEIGVPVALSGGAVTPFVAGRVYRLATNGFAEQGGAAALQGAARTSWSEMTEVGARLATPVVGAISAQGRLAWQHRYGAAQADTTLGFVAGGQSFAVTGADLSRNAAAFDLGLGWAGAKGVTLDVGYHGVLGDRGADHAGRVTLSLAL